jgi:peptidoglycan/xylan/chitin deacetylase (PgdA/CDA1 family)
MLLTSCSDVSQGNIGETLVSKWKDGKKAVYVMSFDDNLPSQLENVIPELNKRKLPGTFYVVPGSPQWAIDEQRWTEASQSPYVTLANHTFTHEGVVSVEDFDSELERANEVIYRIYGDRPQPFLLGFGQPGGVPWDVTPEQQADELKLHNLVERPPFVGSPMNYTTQDGLVASVDQAIASGEMGHDDMHGVGGDYLTTPVEWFIALLDHLEGAKNVLWVSDFVSYAKYLAERQSAKIEAVKVEANEVRLSLTSEADPSLYGYPLTLTTRVPTDWTSVRVIQGSMETKHPVRAGIVMYEAIPGAGEVTVKKD